MKILLSLTLLLLFVSSTFAGDFKNIKDITLKKDVYKKIIVKYGSKKKLFQFRWTLYTNGGLVIHRSYDTIVSQNILYLRHSNQSFRFYLKPKGSDAYNVPYLLVKFEKFDFKKKEAKFKILLSDNEDQIFLKYVKKQQK